VFGRTITSFVIGDRVRVKAGAAYSPAAHASSLLKNLASLKV
jgi:hypothetical protein